MYICVIKISQVFLEIILLLINNTLSSSKSHSLIFINPFSNNKAPMTPSNSSTPTRRVYTHSPKTTITWDAENVPFSSTESDYIVVSCPFLSIDLLYLSLTLFMFKHLVPHTSLTSIHH